MNNQQLYGIVGSLVTVGVDLAVNLVAALVQETSFMEQLKSLSVWWLLALAIAGAAVGYFLGAPVQVQASQAIIRSNDDSEADSPQAVKVTRLRAYWSQFKLRGKGIHLDDVRTFGSRIDIDASED